MDRIIARREQGAAQAAPAIPDGLAKALYSRSPASMQRKADQEIDLLRDLADTMKYGSLCALGGFTPYPVLSALDYFPEDFGAPAPAKEAAE